MKLTGARAARLEIQIFFHIYIQWYLLQKAQILCFVPNYAKFKYKQAPQ